MKKFGGNFSFLSNTPREDFMCRVERELDVEGFAVVVFVPDNRQVFTAFSIGLTGYGHPELAAFGHCEDSARSLMMHLIQLVLGQGKVFSEGTGSTAFFPALDIFDVTDCMGRLDIYEELLGEVPSQILCVRTAGSRVEETRISALAA